MATLGGVRCLSSIRNRGTPLFPKRIRGLPAENNILLHKFDRQRGVRLRCRGVFAANPALTDKSVTEQPAQLGYLTSFDESVSGFAIDVKEVERERKPTPQELDRLLKDSVVEIVKNIGQTPFLVHVYSEDEQGSASSTAKKLVIEEAKSETWHGIKERWNGDNSVPDGVILVEQLEGQDQTLDSGVEDYDSSSYNSTNRNNLLQSSSTKVWGLLIQGRGLNCPSCYILKTCQIQCCFGFSTHFSLAKVDCTGKSLDFHMKKLWLQR